MCVNDYYDGMQNSGMDYELGGEIGELRYKCRN